MLRYGAPGVVTLPESAVEDRGEPLLERSGQLGGVLARFDGAQRPVVALHHTLDILGTACAPLDFQHPHAGSNHPVEEVDGAEVLGREDVAAVDVERLARLPVGDGVLAAANLAAGPPVGRARGLVQAQVALARDGHAEGSVGEHLDFDQLALRAADVVFDDFAVDGGHLLERELAGQHHRVGPLCEEFHRLGVRDVALGRDVDLDPHAARIEDCREVGGDDGVDPFGAGAVDDGMHVGHFVLVDDGVDRQVGLHAVLVGRGDDARQVVEREVRGRSGAHVEFSHAEVDRVGPGVDGGHQRLVGADRGHDFYLGTFHRIRCFRVGCAALARAPESACYFLRPMRLSANSRSGCVRAASTERVSSSARARSNLTEICCSVSRGTSSRS